MFGELLPVATLEWARELCAAARLLVVVGSSLEVHPVAALPYETLSSGGLVAIVNRDPTPIDSRAELRLEGSAGAVLRETVSLLE
jgi:NAD-dependent deacetylase